MNATTLSTVAPHMYRSDTVWLPSDGRPRGFFNWVENGDHTAVSILEEAYALNLQHDEANAYIENDRRNERMATADEIKEVTAARELGATPEQLRRIRGILEERNDALASVQRLQREVERLSGDVKGDDPRLITFWVTAAREATAAGYCPEYDRIAEMAGGPSRETLTEQGHLTNTYRVIVAVTAYHEVEVNAATSGEAVDLAVEEVEEHGSENYDRADGYSENVRYYTHEEIHN